MPRTCLVIALLSSLAACTSKEEQACRSQEKWMREVAERLGETWEPRSKEQLAECIAEQKRDRERFELDESGYEALLDCRIAAKSMDDALACLAPAIEAVREAEFAEVEAKLQAAQRELEQKRDAAIARLEAHVASGVVDARTIASLRAHEGVPTDRVTAIIEDALALIEAGRASAGRPLTIKLQPGFAAAPAEPPVGLDAAELSFADPSTGATVGRLAPLPRDQLGSKSIQIAALLNWMLEAPDERRVEIVVIGSSGSGLYFAAPALDGFVPRFEAAGIADRQVIWLEGVPLTIAQWVGR